MTNEQTAGPSEITPRPLRMIVHPELPRAVIGERLTALGYRLSSVTERAHDIKQAFTWSKTSGETVTLVEVHRLGERHALVTSSSPDVARALESLDVAAIWKDAESADLQIALRAARRLCLLEWDDASEALRGLLLRLLGAPSPLIRLGAFYACLYGMDTSIRPWFVREGRALETDERILSLYDRVVVD